MKVSGLCVVAVHTIFMGGFFLVTHQNSMPLHSVHFDLVLLIRRLVEGMSSSKPRTTLVVGVRQTTREESVLPLSGVPHSPKSLIFSDPTRARIFLHGSARFIGVVPVP